MDKPRLDLIVSDIIDEYKDKVKYNSEIDMLDNIVKKHMSFNNLNSEERKYVFYRIYIE